MLDPSLIAIWDQRAQYVGEVLPLFWRRIFDGCVDQGFSEQQSLDLLRDLVRADGSAMLVETEDIEEDIDE